MILKITGKVITRKETKKGEYFIYQILEGNDIHKIMSKKGNYQVDKTYDFTLTFKTDIFFELEGK